MFRYCPEAQIRNQILRAIFRSLIVSKAVKGFEPPLAYLAVSPGSLVVSPGECNLTVISALDHVKKLGIKTNIFRDDLRWGVCL